MANITPLQIEAALQDYTMPKFDRNEIITWWPSGQAGGGNAEVAVIQEVHKDRIDAVVLGRNGLVVRPFYKTDPRLVSEVYREEGCFDVPPNSNAQRLADIEDRLATIERALDQIPQMQTVLDRLLAVNVPTQPVLNDASDDFLDSERISAPDEKVNNNHLSSASQKSGGTTGTRRPSKSKATADAK